MICGQAVLDVPVVWGGQQQHDVQPPGLPSVDQPCCLLVMCGQTGLDVAIERVRAEQQHHLVLRIAR